MNIAGDEALSRLQFGIRMMDFWGIDYAGKVAEVKGAGIAGLPLDLRLEMSRAHALGFSTPGVSAVVAAIDQ